MRIDSHQHFWTYSKNADDFGWIDDRMEALKRDFGPGDLSPELAAAGFDGCVAVQARETPAETDFLLTIADRHAFVRGVVGWLDLRAPEIEADLERYSEARRLVGLRMPVHDYLDPDFANAKPHARGVGLLRRYGLTYDLLVRPAQLPAASALARRFPDQPFVLDHIAKPNLTVQRDDAWFDRIGALAACDNVFCKLSGMVTEADWADPHSAPFTAYLDHVLELFGPKRLMIGSDWPVCTLAAPYRSVIGIVERWAKDRLSDDERTGLFGETAFSFYGLDR
ncbi:amidohydrolase family protein [Pararhizobium mangrovi]|uniref:amidohydrolase family protein n=1 Tax=Pararhizobium mangrovi TaxID=2590452 RepID=UPI0015E85407|nr:amidohydrolase family protein [Pararhizobium mangrovi]